MIVSSPPVVKSVDEYDFVFSSGMVMPITISPTLGDTVTFSPDLILVNLTSKPSMNTPEKLLPAEDIKIYTSHLISIQHRVREVLELTPEEKYSWESTLQVLSGTIQ